MNERIWTAADFDYELPDELIAQVPAGNRGESRLLVIDRNVIPNEARPQLPQTFAAIIDLIPAGDLLVLNTTRVLHARLRGRRPSGAAAEVLLIHPSTDDSWIAMGK